MPRPVPNVEYVEPQHQQIPIITGQQPQLPQMNPMQPQPFNQQPQYDPNQQQFDPNQQQQMPQPMVPQQQMMPQPMQQAPMPQQQMPQQPMQQMPQQQTQQPMQQMPQQQTQQPMQQPMVPQQQMMPQPMQQMPQQMMPQQSMMPQQPPMAGSITQQIQNQSYGPQTGTDVWMQDDYSDVEDAVNYGVLDPNLIYTFQIVKIEFKASSANKPQIKLTMKVVDEGQYKGIFINDFITRNEETKWKQKALATAIGNYGMNSFGKMGFISMDENAFKGKFVSAKIRNEKLTKTDPTTAVTVEETRSKIDGAYMTPRFIPT